MISKLQSWLLPLLLFCFTLGGFARAESEIQTFMTISVSSWNSFMNDLKTIGETSSNPAFASLVEGPVRFYLGKDMMKAADLNAPIGVALQRFKGESADNTALIFCFPIKEASTLLDFLTKKQDIDLEFTQREDGVIEWDGWYLKEVGGFTWLVTDERQLAQLDSVDPKTFFLMKDGQSLQLTFDPQGFPELPVQVSVAFSEGSELALEKEEDETDEEFELRKKQAEEQKKQLKALLDSMRMISMGIGVNPDEKTLALNTLVSFFPDSEGLKLLKSAYSKKPRFTGFAQAPGLFRGYGISMSIPSSEEVRNIQTNITLKNLEKLLGEDGKKLFSSDLVKPILEEMFSQSENQSGYVLDGKIGAHNLIYASTTTQLAKMQELCEKSVELLKQKTGDKFKDEWFQTNVKAYGMTFSQLTVPTGELFRIINDQIEEKGDENELEALKTWIGETLTFVVGGKDDQLYVGIGSNPIEKLGECLNHQPAQHLSESSIDLRALFSYLEEFMVFARENKLVGFGGKIETKTITPGEAEEEDEEELFEEKSEEDALKDMKKIESLMGVLNEMMEDTEKTNLRMTMDASENDFQIQVLGEEGLLKIIGMLPGLIMMNAL